MPAYSSTSKRHLATCHPDLQRLFNEVIKHRDCKIVQGHRSPEEQQRLYRKGRTEPGPKVTNIDGVTKLSKHNLEPAEAVDVAPWPLAWNDREEFTLFAGLVIGIGRMMDPPVLVRWGGDWDQDFETDDNEFDDLPHFEIVK